MADGKRKLQYDLLIEQTCQIGQLFSGGFNAYNSNPYRIEEVERLRTEEDRKSESEKGFQMLGKALEKMAKKKV